MRLLVAAGCEVNAQAKDGSTAVMEAAFVGYKDCVEFLMANQADIMLTDNVSICMYVCMPTCMYVFMCVCMFLRSIRQT